MTQPGNPMNLEGDVKLAEASSFIQPSHTLRDAVSAYDCLYREGFNYRPTVLWRRAAISLRELIITKCVCARSSILFDDVVSALTQAYGEDRIGANCPDQELRSQMFKAFDHLFPGHRAKTHSTSRLPRPKRGLRPRQRMEDCSRRGKRVPQTEDGHQPLLAHDLPDQVPFSLSALD